MNIKPFLAALLLACTFSAYGQQVDWIIDPLDPRVDFLESLVERRIDSLRQLKGLIPFFTDSVLSATANEQAFFLTQNGGLNLSAEERSLRHRKTNLKNVRARIDKITIHLPESDYPFLPEYYHLNTTYKQTADEIVRKITNNPQYVKYIFSARYQYAGFALNYSSSSYSFVIVHLISEQGVPSIKPNSVTLPEGLEMVVIPEPRSKYGFPLKAPKKNKSFKLARRVAGRRSEELRQPGTVRTSFRKGRRAFPWWHLRTGFLFESRSIRSYDSEKNFHLVQSRCNQRSWLDNEASAFLNARDVLAEARYMRKMANAKKIEIFGLETPFYKPPSGFVVDAMSHAPDSAIRALLIRKGRICAIYNVQPLPAEFISVPFPEVPHTSFTGVPVETERIIHERDTVEATVYYKRGEIDPEDDQLEQLIRQIPIDRKVTHVTMKAFASIEGNAGLNERLFKQRAEKLRAILEREGVLISNAPVVVTTRENWEMFYDQLDKSELEFMKNDSKESLRRYVNKHHKDSIVEAWLNEQRYGEVRLALEDPDTIKITADTLARQFNAQMDVISRMLESKRVISPQQLSKLERLQVGFYTKILADGTPEKLNDLGINKTTEHFVALEFTETLFKLHCGMISDDDLFTWMQSRGFEKRLPRGILAAFRYNSKVYVANRFFLHEDLAEPQKYGYRSFRNYTLNFIKSKRGLFYDDTGKEGVPYLLNEATISSLLREPAIRKDQELYRALRLFYVIKYLETSWPKGVYTSNAKVNTLLTEIWNNYLKGAQLSESERIRWALFLNVYYKLSWSVDLLRPIAEGSNPNHDALLLYISVRDALEKDRHVIRKLIIDSALILTNKEWCDLVSSRLYLPITYLEDYEIRKLYQQKIKQSGQ